MDSFESQAEQHELKKQLAREQGNGAIIDAHKHCSNHRAELMASITAGCFYCCESFGPSEISEWCDGDQTALCPKCAIDSVIGDASGFPAADKTFLKQMNEFWF